MLCKRSWGLGVLLAFFSLSSFADDVGYHNLGPVTMMYDLPGGSSPGWSSPSWMNLEISAGNVWNHNFSMTDKRNGNVYSFFADYEEENTILEFGQALSKDIAV